MPQWVVKFRHTCCRSETPNKMVDGYVSLRCNNTARLSEEQAHEMIMQKLRERHGADEFRVKIESIRKAD